MAFLSSNVTSLTSGTIGTTNGSIFYAGTSATSNIYVSNSSTNFIVGSGAGVNFPGGLRLRRLPPRLQIGNDLFDTNPESAFLELESGQETVIKLPDGAYLWIDEKGGYRFYDADAKVVYKANRVREFNRFLNASDLLEQFIRDLGQVGVQQDEILEIPIHLFINWLIIKSAEQDGEPAPKEVPDLKQALRKEVIKCKCCGKFIDEDRAKLGLTFCSAEHYSMYEKRLEKKHAWHSIRTALHGRVPSPGKRAQKTSV